MIYLDNSATSFYRPKVVKDAILNALENYTANSGRGAYEVARETSLKILEVREKCKDLFGQEFECILTPGCSYSLNLAIIGTVKPNSHIITTYLEHNSVLRVLEHLRQKKQISWTILTDFSKENIEKNIRSNTSMIITTHLSNVTGEIVDINLFSKIAKKHNLLYLIDTAQSAGHIDADFSVADMVAFAGHKGLNGLTGVGGLMVKKGIKLNPILFGGTGTSSVDLNQPHSASEDYEIGSLGSVQIISMGAGIQYFLDNKESIIKKENELSEYLKNKLLSLKFIKPYFNKDNCHGVFSFNVGDFASSLIADILSEDYDICVRSGLHCAPLVHKYYGTINQGMVRVSINEINSKEDIDILINALIEINKKLLK